MLLISYHNSRSVSVLGVEATSSEKTALLFYLLQTNGSSGEGASEVVLIPPFPVTTFVPSVPVLRSICKVAPVSRGAGRNELSGT